jgi:hypothetical protein
MARYNVNNLHGRLFGTDAGMHTSDIFSASPVAPAPQDLRGAVYSEDAMDGEAFAAAAPQQTQGTRASKGSLSPVATPKNLPASAWPSVSLDIDDDVSLLPQQMLIEAPGEWEVRFTQHPHPALRTTFTYDGHTQPTEIIEWTTVRILTALSGRVPFALEFNKLG